MNNLKKQSKKKIRIKYKMNIQETMIHCCTNYQTTILIEIKMKFMDQKKSNRKQYPIILIKMIYR